MGDATTREELLAVELERWASLTELLDLVPESRTSEPSLNDDGWSVRDLVWHLACWNGFVSDRLEEIRLGTFDDDFDWRTDENNATFLAAGRSVTFPESLVRLEGSRREVILSMERLPAVTERAIELFSEPAYQHVDDHLPELRRFVGVPPAPSESSG
jgi:hypothetical protein